MSLEGVEVAAKITGTAAKEIAAFLVAALKSRDSNLKLKGKTRLEAMLKSGKSLEIFSVRDGDLQKFMRGAKQYGIVYCVLRNRKSTPDGLCDFMVKADDAPKISRLIERFQFATVNQARIESEATQSRAGKARNTGAQPDAPDKNDTEKLLDELLGSEEGKPAPEAHKAAAMEATAQQNPAAAKTENPRPSEPTSGSKNRSAGGTLSDVNEYARGSSGSSRGVRSSVKEELREIKAAQSKKEADTPGRDERQADAPKSKPACLCCSLLPAWSKPAADLPR
ncbi:MAG: PcfB family protein [Oscillospiraceae bacterium]|nr:PcfB family protein [Oscillospiraceae bacterium]